MVFKHFPKISEKLPFIALGEFPTPVKRLERLGEDIGISSLYLKDDGPSGRLYGGNKVRKLEFLLGRALLNSVREVMTFGAAGSNHALATAIYARQVGLKCISILTPQPNAEYVRRNLLLAHAYGAEIHYYQNPVLLIAGASYQLLRHKLLRDRFPSVIAPGGTSPLGVAGYVNAAFELEEQVRAGLLPEPDSIYVPVGTMGTAVGLMLGLRAAQLKGEVIGIRVVSSIFSNKRLAARLFNQTGKFLHGLDHSFPLLACTEKDINLEDGFLGPGYAHFTAEGMSAIRRIKETEGIKLEGTYTGKALAALIHDARKSDLRSKSVLFWNTCNSRDLSAEAAKVDYRDLPRNLHSYFEKEVQPLDGKGEIDDQSPGGA